MSATSAPASRRALAFLRERTILVLILLLVVLVAFIGIIRPGTISADWIANTLTTGGVTAVLDRPFAHRQLVSAMSYAQATDALAFMSNTLRAYADPIGFNAGPKSVHVAAVFYHGTSALLAVGLFVGVVNGVGVAIFRVQPLVMTLGTGLMTEGILVVYSQKIIATSPYVPDFIVTLGSGKVFGIVPVDMFLWAPVAVLLILGLRRSGIGRLLYAVGDNTEACKLAGVRVWRVLMVAYVTCSMLSAIAGFVLIGSTDAADLGLANPYLLPGIAAAIIGGTSIFGGRGGYSGTIVGALILTVLESLLTLMDVPEPIKQILYGAIILLLAAAYTRLTD